MTPRAQRPRTREHVTGSAPPNKGGPTQRGPKECVCAGTIAASGTHRFWGCTVRPNDAGGCTNCGYRVFMEGRAKRACPLCGRVCRRESLHALPRGVVGFDVSRQAADAFRAFCANVEWRLDAHAFVWCWACTYAGPRSGHAEVHARVWGAAGNA